MRLVATGLDKRLSELISLSQKVLLNSTGVKQGQAIFSLKGQVVNILDFCGTCDH